MSSSSHAIICDWLVWSIFTWIVLVHVSGIQIHKIQTVNFTKYIYVLHESDPCYLVRNAGKKINSNFAFVVVVDVEWNIIWECGGLFINGENIGGGETWSSQVKMRLLLSAYVSSFSIHIHIHQLRTENNANFFQFRCCF